MPSSEAERIGQADAGKGWPGLPSLVPFPPPALSENPRVLHSKASSGAEALEGVGRKWVGNTGKPMCLHAGGPLEMWREVAGEGLSYIPFCGGHR